MSSGRYWKRGWGAWLALGVLMGACLETREVPCFGAPKGSVEKGAACIAQQPVRAASDAATEASDVDSGRQGRPDTSTRDGSQVGVDSQVGGDGASPDASSEAGSLDGGRGDARVRPYCCRAADPGCPLTEAPANPCRPCSMDAQCAPPLGRCRPDGLCAQCVFEGRDCASPTPACEVNGRCVECTHDRHCAGTETPMCLGQRCVACRHDGDCPGGRCFEGRCVACLDAMDCLEPDAARCDTTRHACVACEANADCLGVATGEVCEDGSCVECTEDDERACDAGQTCDLLARSCADVPPRSLHACERCTHDLQCGSGQLCVPMEYKGKPREDYYCLSTATSCQRPYLGPNASRTSINGVRATLCMPFEGGTTCEALRSAWQPCSSAIDCSPQDEGAAVCAVLNGSASTLCTIPCADQGTCPPSLACSSGYCGGP